MRTVGVMVALAGITASAFVWGAYSDRALDRDRRTTAAEVPADDPAPSATSQLPRVFSAKRPLLSTPHLEDFEKVEIATPASAGRQHEVTTAAARAAREKPQAAMTATEDGPSLPAAVSPRPRLSSLKPGDEESRAQLVRDIQYELRRVGCYSGQVHGSWNSGTKEAMKLFTDRVNARLPLDQPDYVLLTLVENQRSAVCGSECPRGQLASEDGRCVPRAIMAQQRADRQGVASAEPLTQDSPPLPGRMAVGAPADEIVAPAQAEAPQAARRSAAKRQARPSIQRGSTRQVFSRLMQFAP